jgi:hypothetical protein
MLILCKGGSCALNRFAAVVQLVLLTALMWLSADDWAHRWLHRHGGVPAGPVSGRLGMNARNSARPRATCGCLWTHAQRDRQTVEAPVPVSSGGHEEQKDECVISTFRGGASGMVLWLGCVLVPVFGWGVSAIVSPPARVGPWWFHRLPFACGPPRGPDAC